MNEGFLGKFTLEGERAATDDHPVVLHALPLVSGLSAVIAPGTLMKRVITDGNVSYAPCLAADATPCAVVDKPCDPTGEHGETSAICIVHGTVKFRLLKTGDASAPSNAQLVKLMECGVFAV